MDPQKQSSGISPLEISPEEQAEKLLEHIEARTLYATRLIRLLLRQKLTGMKMEIKEYDFGEMMAMFADPTVRLNIYDIESSVEHFRELIRDDDTLQAELFHLIAEKYPFRFLDIPHLRQLLRLDIEAVQDAHEQLYGMSVYDVCSQQPVPDKRPFWLRLPGNMLQEMMDDLAREVEWIYLPSGKILFKQGDIGDGLYTIVSGRIRIVSTGREVEENVSIERGRGAIFGEIAMLSDHKERTATILAVRDTELAKLSVDGFERLFLKHPHFGLLITKLIVSGFREAVSREYQSSQLTTLVVVPIHPTVPMEQFIQKLERALAVFGPVFVLNSKRFDTFLGEGASQLPESSTLHTKLVAWLSDLELANRFVILGTDYEFTEWTKRCLRMADRTLFLVDARQSPELTGIEQRIEQFQDARSVSGRELVLLHPSRDGLPAGTDRWLNHRSVVKHHHVNLDQDDDLAKVGRLLAGRAVGLALSGGGARGMAHIGVIRAIQEAELPIDAVAGTSFGAIIGACLGLEWDWEHIYQAIKEFIGTRSRYFRPALPFVSLMEGHKLSKLFQHYYGSINLEDLWRYFICISANLTESRPEILAKGPVWSAVRASMSLPGVFPPVLRENQILVDGGVFSNLPSDILKERIEGGYVIASDTTVEDSELYEYRNDVSSWQILWARANPRISAGHYPSIAKITSETMALASKWQRSKQLANADVLIHIPVEKYKIFDYDAFEELIELGYRTAADRLEEKGDLLPFS